MNMWERGHAAVGTVCGAGEILTTASYGASIGRDVTFYPDNDEAA